VLHNVIIATPVAKATIQTLCIHTRANRRDYTYCKDNIKSVLTSKHW